MSQISDIANQTYHKDIYDIIISFKDDREIVVDNFKSLKECDEYLELQFSHFDPRQNNTFKLNDPAVKGLPGLFLAVDSLKQLTCSQLISSRTDAL